MLSNNRAWSRIAVSRPTYIGLRTKRLNPVTTSLSVGATGIGVPPALTNWVNACTGGIRPRTISTIPKITRKGGLDPGISKRVINQGPSPTNVPGATTKKAAEPTAAVEVRTYPVLAGISANWVSRTLLPDGSRNPLSMPYGIWCGSSVNSTPRAFISSYDAWQFSVVRNTVPAKPLAVRSITCFCVASSITGSPGTAMSTIDTSSWPGGPTVSQRKVSSKSGSETSWRTSIPTFSVQYFSATSWSWTHRWALAILIMGTTLRSDLAARLLPMCCLGNPGVGGRTGVALEDAARHPGMYR